MDDDDTSWFDTPPIQHDQRRARFSTRKGKLVAGAMAAALLALGGTGAAVVAHAQANNSPNGSLAAVFGWQQDNTTQPGTHSAGAHDRRGHGPLSVTAVTDSTISAKAPDGTAVTIHTSSSTTYGKAGQTVSRGAITTGETINVRGTRNTDGSIAATHVEIVMPSYRGQVTAVSGNTITVRGQGNATHTITVTSSTSYKRDGQSASLSDVKTGDEIDAEGTLASNGVLTAQAVQIELPRAGGRITKIAGNTITVQGRNGTLVITVTGSTTFTQEPGHTSTSLSALKSGDVIQAEGSKNSDGSLTAVAVHVMQPRTGASAPHGRPGDDAPAQSGNQQLPTTQNAAGL